MSDTASATPQYAWNGTPAVAFSSRCSNRVLKLWLRPAAVEPKAQLSDVLCRADW